MALTISRWLTAAGLGSALIGVALLPPRVLEEKPSRRLRSVELRERYRIGSLLREAQDELSLAELHEEINHLPGTDSAHHTPVVLPVGNPPAAVRDSFAARVARLWPAAAGSDSIRLTLVLGGDKNHPQWRRRFLLPQPEKDNRCIVLVPTDSWLNQPTDDGMFLQKIAAEMGPCLFYWSYGDPGPAIERWVSGPGLGFATRFDLSGPKVRVGPTLNEAVPVRAGFMLSWEFYSATPVAIDCIRGQLDRCAQAIFPSSADQMDSTSTRGGFLTPGWEWRSAFGGMTPAYLSDLRRAMGDTLFSRFWHSELSPQQAFEKAFGLSVGEWTYRWVRGGRGALQPGPLPRSRSVVYAGGLALAFMGIAFAIGGRSRLGK